MALPNHHQRGDDINYHHDHPSDVNCRNDCPGVHVHDDTADDYNYFTDNVIHGNANNVNPGKYDDLDAACNNFQLDYSRYERAPDHFGPDFIHDSARAVYDAAAAVLDDAAVGSAGDRMLGPDNPVRGLRAAFIDALADHAAAFRIDVVGLAAKRYVAARDGDT